MNNVEVVCTKETIMTSNNFTEAVTQMESNRKMPQKSKYTQQTHRKTPIDVLPRIHRIPLEQPPSL